MSKLPVTAIIITKNPELSHLGMTLQSLAEQEAPPEEVLIIDSSSGGLPLDNSEECSLCKELVKDSFNNLENQDVKYELVNDESLGRGEARQRGMELANNDYAWHLDEDAVVKNKDWTVRAYNELQKDGVAGVGGAVKPLEESRLWNGVAALENASNAVPGGWYLMHPIVYCEGDQCTVPGQDRGEDISIRSQLRDHGQLKRLSANVAGKDLPTQRQSIARDILVTAVSGGVAGILAGVGRDILGASGK